jgi:hypothetical protein
MSDVYALIRQAILNRAIVTATYKQHVREMCPHMIGYKGRRRKTLLNQFARTSSSGLGPLGSDMNWRCVFVDELQDVSIRPGDGAWYTADDYSRRQTCIDLIDVAVAI